MKAIILSGGLGTRLRPLTCTTPKPLLPLLNKPFLDYQIELLKQHGIKEVTFCLSYKVDVFKQYLLNRKFKNIEIDFLKEDIPLDTGGAVKNAQTVAGKTVLVFNGDILTDLDLTGLLKFHRRKKAKITITLVRVKDPSGYGLVLTKKDGRVVQFLEKPSPEEVTGDTINAGVYVFEPEILDYIPPRTRYSLERQVFPFLLKEKVPFYSYIHEGYWLDIGTPEKYFQAHRDLLEQQGKKSSQGKKTKIGRGVKTEGYVCLGNNCFLGPGSFLQDAVILDGTRLGKEVRIEKSIIGQHCVIEDNVVISPGTILGDQTVVTRYSRI